MFKKFILENPELVVKYKNTIYIYDVCQIRRDLQMLLRIFTAIGAAGAGLHTLIAGQGGGALKVAGVLVLRFFEYFVGSQLAYVLLMLLSTELFIRLDKPQERPSKFWKWHMREVAKMICFYGRAEVIVTGREKLPKDTRYLMVSNHRSLFDPIVAEAAISDEELVYVSKPGNYKIPVGGKVMHKCGCLSLDRENNREALKTIKQATEYINKNYASVVIYPEGTRGREMQMRQFHAGSFKIAQRAGVPVVCASLWNTEVVQHNFPFKKTKVFIDIIDVIDAEYVKEHKTRDTAQLAQNIIQEHLDAVAEEESAAAR